MQESINDDIGNSDRGTVDGPGCGKEFNQGYMYDVV